MNAESNQTLASRSMDETLVLGLDPGLAITGYGVIRSCGGKASLVEAGVIRVSRNQPFTARLRELHEGIGEVIASYPLSAVAIEQLYSHYERPRTAILMGHARGVLCLAAALANVELFSYEATKVKKMLKSQNAVSIRKCKVSIQGN